MQKRHQTALIHFCCCCPSSIQLAKFAKDSGRRNNHGLNILVLIKVRNAETDSTTDNNIILKSKEEGDEKEGEAKFKAVLVVEGQSDEN